MKCLKVCIVIPIYNEQDIVRNSIDTILKYTKKLPPIVTVLVVNDGSVDATEQIVNEIVNNQESEKLMLISHSKNQGYGAAIKTGINFASTNEYDYILFMDCDLTNHPKYLEDFYKKMIKGYDYIKATRYGKNASVFGVPLQKKILSIVGNLIARILYGMPLKDVTNGFRAAKVEIMKTIDLKENGFVIIMEELYYVKSIAKTFCEVPFELTSRADSQGKSKFSYGPAAIYSYLKYPLKTFFESHSNNFN